MCDTPVEILLVEDNPNDIELTLHAIKGYCPANHVKVARDGVEALDFALCTGLYAGRDPLQQPKLVLMDLKLPRIDGLQVLRRLKDDPRTRAIPVIILSSSSDPNDVAETYRLGVNSYIVKPVDYDAFLQAARVLGTYWLQLNHLPGIG
jgi:two-component system response regulator